MLAVVGGLLSVWLGELTHINYAILGLVLGVIFTQLGVVPKNLLQKAQASGFINMVVFAAIIPALANISISDLIDLILPLVVVFAVSVLSIFVMMKVLPVWKILGDKSMAFGVGFCQMLGFPSTYLKLRAFPYRHLVRKKAREMAKKISPETLKTQGFPGSAAQMY